MAGGALPLKQNQTVTTKIFAVYTPVTTSREEPKRLH